MVKVIRFAGQTISLSTKEVDTSALLQSASFFHLSTNSSVGCNSTMIQSLSEGFSRRHLLYLQGTIRQFEVTWGGITMDASLAGSEHAAAANGSERSVEPGRVAIPRTAVEPSPRRRHRVVRACQACRGRKIKCGGEKPSYGQCSALRIHCV